MKLKIRIPGSSKRRSQEREFFSKNTKFFRKKKYSVSSRTKPTKPDKIGSCIRHKHMYNRLSVSHT